MTEQWQELKETITEMRDNDGTGTQQEVCKFLVNYMEILEKQMQEPTDDYFRKKAGVVISQLRADRDRLEDELAKREQEPKTGWNNHQIAWILADLFGDTCACNYNGIDEWLSELCDFKDTCCPHPVGVACWEQFLKYSQSRYTKCGYEVRDKGASQEPKTGHWINDEDTIGCYYCSECGGYVASYDDAYCKYCGAKMESEEV